jgi:HSP20 family protein
MKNAAPNFSGMVAAIAASPNDCRSTLMFVVPLRYALPRHAFHPAWNGTSPRRIDADADMALRPAMDVAETETGYTLSFDLPGMAKEHVKVTIDGRVVSVEAATTDERNTAAETRLIHRERRVPRFARSVSLPSELDAATSQARFADGVLTLTVVKKVREGAKTLAIQ